MAKPARPKLIFNSIDEMVADADRLGSGPYDKAGQWDLPMILNHLSKAMDSFATAQTPVRWPLDIVARVGIHLMAKRKYYPPISISAPKEMQPAASVPLETAQAEFRAAAEKVKAFKGPKVSGTPFGTLPLEDFIKLQLLHGAHHLSYLSART
jgi:hypothetical protein